MVWLGLLLLTPAIVSYNRDLLFNGAARTLTLRLLVSFGVAAAMLTGGWRFWGEALGKISDATFPLKILSG